MKQRLQKFCRHGKCKFALSRITKMRKGRQFILGEEQQNAFEEIKGRLPEPPVLYLPGNIGRFHSYSDSFKFSAGSALYQIQNGK